MYEQPGTAAAAAAAAAAPALRRRHHHHEGEAEDEDEALHIYDGFDFGFAKTQARSADDDAVVVGVATTARRLRAPKSETDLHRRRPQQLHFTPGEMHAPPSPTASHLRPRPAGMDEADYFIKRGGWKRQGIVFGGASSDDSSMSSLYPSEDDLF